MSSSATSTAGASGTAYCCPPSTAAAGDAAGRGYRVGHAPYNGTLYLPAGFHDYGIATVDELFVALVVGRCEFLCEYQDEIDEVYHGLFEKRI